MHIVSKDTHLCTYIIVVVVVLHVPVKQYLLVVGTYNAYICIFVPILSCVLQRSICA